MRLLLLLTSVALVIGAFALPIGYYTLLRILVCISAIIIVVSEYDGEIGTTQIIFGLIAMLFNPLMPIYLHNKGIWKIIDLIAAAIFLFKALSVTEPKPKNISQ